MSNIFQNSTVVMEAWEKNAKTFKSWWITGSNENWDSLPVPQIDDDKGEIWASQHVGSGHILWLQNIQSKLSNVIKCLILIFLLTKHSSSFSNVANNWWWFMRRKPYTTYYISTLFVSISSFPVLLSSVSSRLIPASGTIFVPQVDIKWTAALCVRQTDGKCSQCGEMWAPNAALAISQDSGQLNRFFWIFGYSVTYIN